MARLARIRSSIITSLWLGLVLALAGCAGGHAQTSSARRSAHSKRGGAKGASGRPAPGLARPVRLSYRSLFSLRAPLRDPASAVLPDGRFVLLGGLDAADTSSAGIEVASPRGLLSSSALPAAQHDAQATALGGKVYVFGGGSLSELDHILSFDPARGVVGAAGSLPRAQSDVAVAELGGTAYVVGGYDGTSWLDTILAWRPGSAVRVAGHLPVGLRYSSVSAVDGRLLIIGGSTPSGATDAVYSFDPGSGGVRRIGRLPQPITHAGAATLGSSVYLVGGRGDSTSSQTAAVWGIDPLTGAVHPAGRLPRALSDVGVVAVGGAIVVAGGLTPAGTVAGVGELVPSRG
ncbi:MAG: hypothetical protein ACR2MK_02720 [Solirubrobacteraceae bacterium]